MYRLYFILDRPEMFNFSYIVNVIGQHFPLCCVCVCVFGAVCFELLMNKERIEKDGRHVRALGQNILNNNNNKEGTDGI